MMNLQALAAAVPLLPSAYLLVKEIGNPLPIVIGWINFVLFERHAQHDDSIPKDIPPVGSQLLAYVAVGILGFYLTNNLVPHIKV